jgi:hypothetical protein
VLLIKRRGVAVGISGPGAWHLAAPLVIKRALGARAVGAAITSRAAVVARRGGRAVVAALGAAFFGVSAEAARYVVVVKSAS